MELSCTKNNFMEPSAIFDSAIIDDDRTLSNLILTEENYLITGSYFKCLQTDISPSNRTELASWMLEVCEAEKCQSEVFPLAMNILDRFLALVKLKKSQLQLLGSVCLFIAAKLRQSKCISPGNLIFYTDWSITMEELTDWELLVLSKLKWDVAAITPNDFVEPLMRRLCEYSLIDERQTRIKKHILNMIDLCSLDFNFSMYPPSMIAAASIITAIDGLLALTENHYIYRSISTQVLYQLHKLTGIEKELLRECHLQIEQKILAMKNGNSSEANDHVHHHHHHHHHQQNYNIDNRKSSSTSSSSSSCIDHHLVDDCSKENAFRNQSTLNLLVDSRDCTQSHLNYSKHHHYHHTATLPNDTSIGVKF